MSLLQSDEIQPWDSDHTALVHVLWDVKRKGLTVEHNADEIASRVMRSKWMRAVRLHAGERDRELHEIADWLRRQNFPYDWTTSEVAPACLLFPLAQAWVDAEQDGAEPPTVEDWISTMRVEQRWTDDPAAPNEERPS